MRMTRHSIHHIACFSLCQQFSHNSRIHLLKTVVHLQDQALPASEALYLLALGAAEALYLDERLGNFEYGKEADFIVLDPAATSLSARRSRAASSTEEILFALTMLAHDRLVAATYVAGKQAKIKLRR